MTCRMPSGRVCDRGQESVRAFCSGQMKKVTANRNGGLNTGRFAACAVLSAVTMSAAVLRSAPVPMDRAAWDGSPIAWRFDAGEKRVEATGVDDCMLLETERSAKIAVTAVAVPGKCRSRDWATFGMGITDDENNYWRLSFVQAPPKKDGTEGARFFELSEMRNGRWLAQNHDRLVSAGGLQNETWDYGKSYRLSLKLDSGFIHGEVWEASGRFLYSAKFRFPEPTPDGSVKAVTCGKPSLHSKGLFSGSFSRVDAECSMRRPKRAAKRDVPPYASESFVPGVAGTPSGFFRVAKHGDGKWWAFDPLGRGTALLGVNHASYQGQWSLRTMRSIHRETNLRKFPDRTDWATNSVARLKSWGFNMIGGGSDSNLKYRGLFHAFTLAMGETVCRDGVPGEYFICPNERRPCTSFPNVFHPDFDAWCDYVARRKCAPNRDDPWLFGYFIDNELAWWGRGMLDTGLYDAVAKLPESHSARKAQKSFMSRRKPDGGDASVQDKLDFLKLAAERYFSATSAAIRRADPNHLILGARFAGIRGAHPVVWEVAGKYCDVVTLNCYPWADLDRNMVRMGRSLDSEPLSESFGKLYDITRRPILVTEWSFPALDTGRPCSHGAGQRFRTQALRAKASELFVRTLLSLPYVLGYNYFMWVDQPAAGLSDAFPEDCNYGLLSEEGVPYRELTSVFARLHKDIAGLRNAKLPRQRPFSSPPTILAPEAERRLVKCGDAKYVRNGDRYAISTPGGLLLEGTVGGRDIFSSVKVGGLELGRFNMMLCDKVRGNSRWRNLSKVRSVQWKDGALEILSEGGTASGRFSFVCRIVPLSGRNWFLCDLVRVSNMGDSTMDVSSFLFRQYVKYAEDKSKVAEFKSAPDLWQAPDADAWFRKSDRAFFGGFTRAGTVVRFQYFTSTGGRVQHPDAQFEPADRSPLAPGASYAPKGSVWMVAVCGSQGGRDAWNAAVDELAQICTQGKGMK